MNGEGGGVLEILLVNAQGFKQTTLLGRPCFYAILHCGSDSYNSKVTTGKRHKAWWNQKFIFKIPEASTRKSRKLTLRIMEKDKYKGDNLVGETTVPLGIILKEGRSKGNVELKPTAYNIIVPGGKYKGEIKLGLKFISSNGLQDYLQMQRDGGSMDKTRKKQETVAIYRAILNLGFFFRRIFNLIKTSFRPSSRRSHGGRKIRQ